MDTFEAELKAERRHNQETESKYRKAKNSKTSEDQKSSFRVNEVLGREGKMTKNVFKYYTAIANIRFAGLLAFWYLLDPQ